MNKAAITKHEIYNKLVGFTEQDLSDIVNFIDFIRHKNKLKGKKIVVNEARPRRDRGDGGRGRRF